MYQITPCSIESEEMAFENIVEKCVISIFSFSHCILNPLDLNCFLHLQIPSDCFGIGFC